MRSIVLLYLVFWWSKHRGGYIEETPHLSPRGSGMADQKNPCLTREGGLPKELLSKLKTKVGGLESWLSIQAVLIEDLIQLPVPTAHNHL